MMLFLPRASGVCIQSCPEALADNVVLDDLILNEMIKSFLLIRFKQRN